MAPKTRSADPRKPSRGKHAWTIREEEYLAELYEQETFIYDMGSDDYQKTEKKNNKHQSISNILGIPCKFVAIRIIKSVYKHSDNYTTLINHGNTESNGTNTV